MSVPDAQWLRATWLGKVCEDVEYPAGNRAGRYHQMEEIYYDHD